MLALYGNHDEALTQLRVWLGKYPEPARLIHRSAGFLVPGDWPKEIEPYKNVIPQTPTSTPADWTSLVLGVETADWAFDTAMDLLETVDPLSPDPARLPFIDHGR